MSVTTEAAVLTLSEQVILNGAALVPPGGLLDKYRLLGTEHEVSKKRLAALVCAAAFLAAEKAGCIRLAIKPKKALLGLRTVDALYAEPAEDTAEWPAASLEARIRPLAVSYSAKKPQHEVSNIIYGFIREDVTSPSDTYLGLVYDGLAARGLLQTVEEKKLKIFTTRHYVMPPETAALGNQLAGAVQSILDEYQTGRPDVWKKLLAEVESGMARRTKQTDTSTE